MLKTGLGYDIHPLAAGRRFVLGGVEIPHPKGPAGHSKYVRYRHQNLTVLGL